MSSTAAEPPPGVDPGGQAGQPTTSSQASASSTHQTSQTQHSEGDETGGDEARRFDPRPPIPGGEDLCKTLHSHHGRKKELVDWGKATHCGGLPYFYSQFQGEGGGDGLAVGGGSVEGGSPCCGGGDGGTTPPAVRWSESLLQLLEDSQGVQLFQEYLKEECGSFESLDFWFACNGLRKSGRDPVQLVTIIWKRYIRNFKVRVSETTHKNINDNIHAKNITCNIFDDAQREVEEEIARSTYPSFLKSERYLMYLANQHAGVGPPDSPHSLSPCSPGGGTVGGGTVLPTLHEDCELEGNIMHSPHLRLTQGALAATVKLRAAAERRKPEAFAGQYLHGKNRSGGVGVNPYHAVYSSAHMSSRQDSELQSLSSGALTDDTISCTDSSLDGMSLVGFGHSVNPKHLKKQYSKMRENARMNRELALSAAGGGFALSQGGDGAFPHGNVVFLPRTHRIRHESPCKLTPPKPQEFAAQLIEKLEKVKRDRESQAKMELSFKKIIEGDTESDEYRRQHAFNSLPPTVLFDKLTQNIPLDDADPCQSILDNHVSRVWQDSNNDSPAQSPGSPRPRSPTGRKSGSTQSTRPQPQSHHAPKAGIMVGGTHPSMYVSGANFLPSSQSTHPIHLPPGHPGRLPSGHPAHLPPGHPAHLPPGHMPHPYQTSKNWHHTRRRDRGQDVYSTFSSDSGNVADYYESNDRGGLHSLPKSRSMPEYMENYAGTNSDGGSCGRRQPSGRRSSSWRPPADLTDSGVSVVSGSGPSLTPSASSTERVTSWLLDSDKFSGSVSSSSCYQETDWDPRIRGSRSTHTAAGATSPGTLRRSSSGGGRRSVSGGSIGGGCTVGSGGGSMSAGGSVGGGGNTGGVRSGSLERGSSSWLPSPNLEQRDPSAYPAHALHSPHTAHAAYSCHAPHPTHGSHSDDKRRSRGGAHGSSRSSSHGWSHSESGSGKGPSHADSGSSGLAASGSNGSTLRKHRPSRHSQPTPPGVTYESGGSGSSYSGTGLAASSASNTGPVGSNSGSSSSTGSGESTTIVYNFHDDAVPFVTRIPTRPVTLKRFKQHLPKKGNYRFFFKKQCEEFGIIQEEITEDSELLPLFEGKIFAQIRKAD